MRLGAAIEEADRADETLLIAEFGSEWRDIRGMRNAIAHNYMFIDATFVRSTIARDAHRLSDGLANIRDSLGPGGQSEV